MEFSLFFPSASDGTRENSIRLPKGKFRSDIRKNFFTKVVFRHWNKLSREMAESQCLEAFKRGINTMLRDMVYSCTWQSKGWP